MIFHLYSEFAASLGKVASPHLLEREHVDRKGYIHVPFELVGSDKMLYGCDQTGRQYFAFGVHMVEGSKTIPKVVVAFRHNLESNKWVCVELGFTAHSCTEMIGKVQEAMWSTPDVAPGELISYALSC